MAHCPHCQADLPDEEASFCAACGRRVAGWKGVARKGGEEPLPGSEEPTRQMQPTPSLLRVAAAKKNGVTHEAARAAASVSRKGPTTSGDVETDSAMMRAIKRNPVPSLIAFVLLAAGAGAGAFFLVRHARKEAAPVAEAKAPVPVPVPVPVPAPVAAPAKPPQKVAHKKSPPKRMQPLAIPSKKQIASAAKSGGLPHKGVQTDSKPLATAAAPAPSAPAPAADVPFVPKPPTDEELRHVAEDHFDAESVRQVVANKMPQVRACYERAFKFNSPGGKVEVGFTITGDGRTTNVHTESNTTDSEPFARCIEEHVKQWQFPHPLGGEVELIYPFVFAEGS